MAVHLTRQQSAAVENRGGELLVSAAAGSGKTRILVERLLNRVEREHIDLDRFLVITYTKAAAAELRGKILEELNERLAQNPNDPFLRRQRLVLYRAQISTIHSFCTALLREEGYRIDLEPDFRVGDDGECAPLRLQALERLLEERYEHIADHPDFAALADTLGAGRDDSRLSEILLDVFTRIQSHPDPEGWLRTQAAAFDLRGVRDVAETRWGELLMEDARSQVEYWHGRFVQALDLLQEDAGLERAYSESFDATLDSMDDFLSALDRGWDSARALLPIAFPKLRPAPRDADPALKERLSLMRTQCKKRMEKLRETFSDSSAALLADMEAVRPVITCLHELVIDFSHAYAAEKRRRNLVDFSDLEHLSLALLRDENHNPTEAALRWRGRYAEIMVDEYQDTNQVQNAIFAAVSDEGRNLFEVGDVKQSIYRFRLADPSIFLEKYDAFFPAEGAEEGAPRKLVLSYNFRSRPQVLEGTNFVFEHIMSRAFGEMDYTGDQRLYPFPDLPYPEHPDPRLELDVVDMAKLPQPEDEARIRRDEVECDFIAHRIRQLLDEKFPVTEQGELRPVR
ncbi:MAG: UvrD-helicase domain-containing protein, partial [Oscillospiraceae bacterium]|nr:UvrD-helicase domain-containing protein [Oscillospiraceae bacterium]